LFFGHGGEDDSSQRPSPHNFHQTQNGRETSPSFSYLLSPLCDREMLFHYSHILGMMLSFDPANTVAKDPMAFL